MVIFYFNLSLNHIEIHLSANSVFSPSLLYMSGKVIQLNPAFLKLSKSKSSTKTPKREKKKMRSLGANKLEHKLKTKLMSSIHKFQERAEQEQNEQDENHSKTNDIENEIQVFDTEFNKSIEFLKELAEKKRKRQTLKHKTNLGDNSGQQEQQKQEQQPQQPQQPQQNHQDHKHQEPSQSSQPIKVNTENLDLTVETPSLPNIPTTPKTELPKTNTPMISNPNKTYSHNQTVKIKPPPPYTCLKNSSSMKPTYRQWMTRNNRGSTSQEQPITIHPNPLTETSVVNRNIETSQTTPSIRSQKLAEIKSQISATRVPRKLRRKKMTTLKHKLGKSGRKVCVLIKNHQTRKQIQREYGALKQKKISEVRTYLKKHNLLKGGSVAPNDVLKATYEQAILAGEINNSNSEALIHNYNTHDNK